MLSHLMRLRHGEQLARVLTDRQTDTVTTLRVRRVQRADVGGGGGETVVDWSDYWNPRLYVENAIGELRTSTSRSVQHNDTCPDPYSDT